MELYVMFVFLALLGLSSAFLMPDILANQTTSVSHGSGHTIESNNQKIEDIMTFLAEEKRLRYQLEQRLEATEKQLELSNRFHDAVTAELQTERQTIQRLEKALNDSSCSSCENNGTIAKEAQILETIKSLQQKLDNATSVIDRLTLDLQVESNNANGLEQKLNMTFVEINNLKNDVQDLNTTQQLLESYSNSSSLRNNNMVAFSVDNPDNSHHNPQHFSQLTLNIGGAFDTGTGIFTCKQPGVYVFMWTATQSSSGSYHFCCLQINGSRLGYACAITGGGTGQHPSGSRSTIARLKTNDNVNLYCYSGSYDANSGFSGFLLYPDN